MVRACGNGRRVGLDRQRNALADQYYPMAAAMSRPYRRAWPQARDEFESAAGLALVLAADQFDDQRNVPFPLFAARRIEWALRNVRRGLDSHDQQGPVREPDPGPRQKGGPRNPCDWPRGDLQRPLEDRNPTLEVDEVDAFEARIHGLPAPYARVCRALFLHGLTVSETARALGLTQPRVTQLRDQALRRLRKGNGRAPRRYPSPRQERPWPSDSARSTEDPPAPGAGKTPNWPAHTEPAPPTLTHLGSECPCSS